MFSFFREDPESIDPDRSVARLKSLGAFPEVPPQEVPFWDVPAVLVILLFVVAAVLAVPRGRWAVAGSAIGPTPPDPLLQHLTSVTAEMGTQTMAETIDLTPPESTGSDWTSLDVWQPLAEVTPTVDPAVLGQNAAYFWSMPWGYLFAGGALLAGVIWAVPWFWRTRRILDRPRRTLLQLIALPFVMFGGGFLVVTVFYTGGYFLGCFAGPTVLAREFVQYLLDSRIPGFRGGAFSPTAVFTDLTNAFFVSAEETAEILDRLGVIVFCPYRLARRVAAVAVAGVLFEHVVTVNTSWTDLDEYARLVSLQKEIAAETARLVTDRAAHWADHPPDDEAVRKRIEEVHDVLVKANRANYGSHLKMVQTLEPLREVLEKDFTVPHRRATLVERAWAQLGRWRG